MRKSLSIIFLAVAIAVSAASPEKEYKKMAERHDVAMEARVLDGGNPSEFWATMLKNDESLKKFKKDLAEKRDGKSARKRLEGTDRFYPAYDSAVIPEYQAYCDSLLSAMGLPQGEVPCSMHIINDVTVDAYTILTDDGFAICLPVALWSKPGCSDDIVRAIVAHQFAHGALLHHVRGYFDQARKERREKIWGGILIGTVVAASITLDALTPNDCNHGDIYVDNSVNVNNSTINIGTEPQTITKAELYGCDFSREQVFEADLVGYRYMEHMGEADKYAEMLRFMGADYDLNRAGLENHPTTATRIAFVNYIAAHPELGNTRNLKLRK